MEEERDLAGCAVMKNPPTFHTVRSLANSLAKNAQKPKEVIQKNNAHKSVDTQLIYQEGHELPFDDAPIQLTAEHSTNQLINVAKLLINTRFSAIYNACYHFG